MSLWELFRSDRAELNVKILKNANWGGVSVTPKLKVPNPQYFPFASGGAAVTALPLYKCQPRVRILVSQ